LSEIRTAIAKRSELKGECPLLVAGAAGVEPLSDTQLADMLEEALSRPGVHLSGLSRSLAGTYNIPRKRVYDLALKIRQRIGKRT
jgi:hypothetical protein